ncbi:MAG: hypothetical protein JWM35_1924, partial [Verrucomicrobia bacterium]|nr:hypothetical protein [Verrucomicrobiota bacterium]
MTTLDGRRESVVPRSFRSFHPLLPLGLALVALVVSVFFFSPRLWVFAQPMPGSTYWDRGLQFMQQCDSPIGAPLSDAALTWRLAPALLAKTLGLHGRAVFVLPWVGVVLLLALCATFMLRRAQEIKTAALATVLVGSTGAVLTPTGWLGMNDAWYASALVAIAFQPGLFFVALAALIGPWIDERFIFALPLALYVRHAAGTSLAGIRPAIAVSAGAVALYTVARVWNLPHLATGSFQGYQDYIRAHFFDWWPWTSLGWFMGLRAAWVLVVVAIGGNFAREDRRSLWWPAFLAIAPLVAFNFLAADTGRSPTMLLPLVLFGVSRAIALWGLPSARRLLGILVISNLLLPAMQVTYRNGDIINALP